MTAFIYYISGVSRVTPTLLRDWGLGYAFDDRCTPREVLRGPDGGHGCAVADERCVPISKVGYFPDRQTWRKSHLTAEPAIWVGMYTEDRPTPDVLARGDLLDGVWLELDDGHRWLAPRARRWEEFGEQLLWICNLPQRLSLSEDGLWTLGDVKPRYARLWNLALAYEQAFAAAVAATTEADGGVVRFQFDAIDELAIGALQVNYRVGPAELDLLGVYDLEARQQIIDALLDQATWSGWVKKKLAAAALAGSNSCSGPGRSMAAGALDTSQLTPSCEPTQPVSTATTSSP